MTQLRHHTVLQPKIFYTLLAPASGSTRPTSSFVLLPGCQVRSDRYQRSDCCFRLVCTSGDVRDNLHTANQVHYGHSAKELPGGRASAHAAHSGDTG
jgi:hypothetical protein